MYLDAGGLEQVLRILQLSGEVESTLCVDELLGLGDGVADKRVDLAQLLLRPARVAVHQRRRGSGPPRVVADHAAVGGECMSLGADLAASRVRRYSAGGM
ncbi:hypothetical protein SMF913_26861 [Streptomyces malaysiensis]|uniref:Uncharacterized protein n=1 Tax=Streptomyces malaysiensis TaxID=92644 RepID=A0A2J7YTN2_STRMQ|nr:hypothetical protein SMF913_26861 [Streptomyces malaysiensis]